jgi:uncharacterized caspase-like protein
MKRQTILSLALLVSSTMMYAQSSSYETWRKQKEQAYAKWQKLRGETDDLATSQEQEEIGNFIDAGFGNAPAASPPQAAPASSLPAGQAPSPNMRIWVVVAGVADYQAIDKLNYTDDDAYRMYAFYKSPEGGSLPDSQIDVLIDEAATRNNVMQSMNRIYANAGRNDAIIFYFSGHGAKNAFVTQEYNGWTANGEGLLGHDEIQRIFEKSPAKYKYIIADACHSGSWAQKGVKSASATGQQYYEAFEKAQGGFVLLLSSMSDEYSLEQSGIRQGIFSHFLIRGLKGEADANKDRVVSVIELFEYVESNVVQSTKHRQTPVISGNYKGNPPVSIVRSPVSEP